MSQDDTLPVHKDARSDTSAAGQSEQEFRNVAAVFNHGPGRGKSSMHSTFVIALLWLPPLLVPVVNVARGRDAIRQASHRGADNGVFVIANQLLWGSIILLSTACAAAYCVVTKRVRVTWAAVPLCGPVWILYYLWMLQYGIG